MKRISTIFALILTASILFSCKQDKKEADNGQMKEVVAIHDEVMPKMGKIGKLVGELVAKEDSTAVGQRYAQARKDLQAAHKSMMDWMQGFGSRFDADEILNGKALTDEKKQWLNEEEVKVKALRTQVDTSIENAEALLAE